MLSSNRPEAILHSLHSPSLTWLKSPNPSHVPFSLLQVRPPLLITKHANSCSSPVLLLPDLTSPSLPQHTWPPHYSKMSCTYIALWTDPEWSHAVQHALEAQTAWRPAPHLHGEDTKKCLPPNLATTDKKTTFQNIVLFLVCFIQSPDFWPARKRTVKTGHDWSMFSHTSSSRGIELVFIRKSWKNSKLNKLILPLQTAISLTQQSMFTKRCRINRHHTFLQHWDTEKLLTFFKPRKKPALSPIKNLHYHNIMQLNTSVFTSQYRCTSLT